MGSVGRVDPARNPGRNPRALATLRELFTCTLSASDPGDPENELAQYKATRFLFDAWFRAVYLAAHGTLTVERSDWLIRHNDRRFGTAMRVVCSIQAMVPDAALDGIPIDTRAVTGVSELDVTETQTDVASG
jgi:hypothetical protein